MNRGPVLLIAVVAVVAAMGAWVLWNLSPDAPLIAAADRARITVLPLPTDLALQEENLSLDDGLAVEILGHTEPRLERGVERMRTRLPRAAGREGSVRLTIDVGVAADEGDPVWIDESYALDVSEDGVRLRAVTPVGAMHGLQTFVQLVESDTEGVRIPIARIRDAPRFRWRGLMIDVCRHWIPKGVILRNLDAMEAAKMNVLHLHLTEDQAFRVESVAYPRLHEVGAGGDYFTQDDLREIVAYAHDRGIRVVPEFDLPGHSLSWLEAYPSLAIGPGPWEKAKQYGIHPVALDPTREEVYEFLDTFFGEMAGIFPDPYVHIGGDEANPELWDANERLAAYQREHGLSDHKALQAHFNQRLHGILAGHGKKMMGWEEIRHEDLPRDAVVQAWLAPGGLAAAVAGGYESVLSQGYYLDHKQHAAAHYGVDPLAGSEPVDIPTDGPWQSWAVELDTPAGKMEGHFVVWGEGESQGGVSVVAGQVLVLDDVRFEGGVLRATADSPVGKATIEAAADGDGFAGSFDSLVISVEVTGRRTGGHDLPGTLPPDLQTAAEILPEDRYRVFGGEAAMWTELVTAKTLDSRVWPRTAAIAERLWSSPESANDVDDMYRRLDVFSERLGALGLTHESYREEMLEDIAGGPVPPALRTLVAVLEETKSYERHRLFGETPLTTETPLDRIADAAAPESRTARRFSSDVDALLAGEDSRRSSVSAHLDLWRDQHGDLLELFEASERVGAMEPRSRALADASVVGLEALDALQRGATLEASGGAARAEILDRADQTDDGALLAVAPALRRLVEAVEAQVRAEVAEP